jgi:riboflavin synthase alpha subunit
MFTGIIETLGVIQEIKENSNIHITMNSTITGNYKLTKRSA